MNFKSFIVCLSLLASVQVHAAVKNSGGNSDVGDNNTPEAMAVDKIVQDLVNRFTPEIIKNIAYAQLNVNRATLKFSNDSTKISNVDATMKFGLSGVIKLPLIEESQLPKFPTLKTYNSATIKDFIPVLKIGPARTEVSVRAQSLVKDDGIIEVTIEFLQNGVNGGLRVEANGEKIRVNSFTLKQVKFSIVTGEKGKISLTNGSCRLLQDVAELMFDKNGKFVEGPMKTKPAMCDYSGYYNYQTKKYDFTLNYATSAVIDNTNK